GANPHTVTADDGAFDSGTLQPGDTFSVTFDAPERVPYYCQIHGAPGSAMWGAVIVERSSTDSGDGRGTDAGGLARTGLDPVPAAFEALGLAVLGLVSLRIARRRGAEGG
ncbi:MAG: hypothetical protein HYU54_11505, partial [Actinobacteria bacterium]|nr:hypothetical protein [Actinomycetota bacterium]